MRSAELIASMALASHAKPARSHSNLSALDRCKRAFGALTVVVVGLTAFALEAAPQDRVYRIGILQGVPVPEGEQAFDDEMRAKGYDVGRNFQKDIRYTQGQSDRIPALLAELMALHPDIIVATNPQNAVAVHASSPTIPFVFISVADPVGLGLVPNMAHPGGNVTGVATSVPEGFAAKELQLLKTVAPAASRIAILLNPKNQMHQQEQMKFPDTARQLGVELIPVQASKVEELEAAFQDAHAKGAEAVFVFGDALHIRASTTIAKLALQYRWPSICLSRQNVQDGALMSYGSNPIELVRAHARQIDRILKGAKPGDLPVEQPTRFDLTINLKTAKALGITVPTTLLAQAAEVIE